MYTAYVIVNLASLSILYLNFKLSNEKAQFVTREHEIKYDIKPTSSFSEPAFLLTMFHPMFPGEHGVEHYSCQPRETTRTTSAKWGENFMLFKSKWRRWRRAQSRPESDEEIQRILDERHSKNTTKATKNALKKFSETVGDVQSLTSMQF